MDAQTQELMELLPSLTKSEKADILYLVMFLHWRKHGGRKTAEIRRGEKIHKEFEREKLTETAA